MYLSSHCLTLPPGHIFVLTCSLCLEFVAPLNLVRCLTFIFTFNRQKVGQEERTLLAIITLSVILPNAIVAWFDTASCMILLVIIAWCDTDACHSCLSGMMLFAATFQRNPAMSLNS